MKKFIASILAIATLTAFIQEPAFALRTQCTKAGKNLITATINKPTTYPWTNNDMTAHCLGVLELKIAKPENLMQNTTIQVKTNKEPLKYFNWSNIDWKNLSTMQRAGIILKTIFNAIFFQRSLRRREVNSFKLTGLPMQASWYNVPERLLNWLFDRRIPVEYRLVQIEPDKVKKLTAKPVRVGEKKPEIVNSDDAYKNIHDVNGKSDVVKLRDELLSRALNAFKNPNVDPHDPFNIIENGNFLKLGDYKEQIDTSLYYSRKEADEKNKEIESEKKKLCDEFAAIYNEDLKNTGILGTLSAEKPNLNFAIVVNDNIDDSAESYKLSHFLATNGYAFLKADKSIIEFDAQKIFTVPDAGVPADEAQRNKALADIAATKAKPGFKQWTKNKFNTLIKGAKFVLPQVVTDFIEAVCNLLGFNSGGNNEVYLAPDPDAPAAPPAQPVQVPQPGNGNNAVAPGNPQGGNVAAQPGGGQQPQNAQQQNPQPAAPAAQQPQQNPPAQPGAGNLPQGGNGVAVQQQPQSGNPPNVVVNVIQNQQQNQNNQPQLAISDPQLQVN